MHTDGLSYCSVNLYICTALPSKVGAKHTLFAKVVPKYQTLAHALVGRLHKRSVFERKSAQSSYRGTVFSNVFTKRASLFVRTDDLLLNKPLAPAAADFSRLYCCEHKAGRHLILHSNITRVPVCEKISKTFAIPFPNNGDAMA